MVTAHGRGSIQIDASVKGVDSIKTSTGEFQKLQVRVSGLSGAFDKLGSVMTKSVLSGNLYTAAIGAASAAIGSAVQNALEWEDVVGKNSVTVNALTSAVGNLVSGVEAAKFQQSIFGEGLSLSTEQMLAAEKAAVAYARRHEVDIPTALEKVRRLILTGKGTFFAEMGMDVKLVGTASERTAQALRVLSDRFGDLQFSAENTDEKIKTVKNSLGDAFAELGAALLQSSPVQAGLGLFATTIGKAAEFIRGLSSDLTKMTSSVGGFFDVMYTKLEKFGRFLLGWSGRKIWDSLFGGGKSRAEMIIDSAFAGKPSGVSFIPQREDAEKEKDPDWLRNPSAKTMAKRRARERAGGLKAELGLVDDGGKPFAESVKLEFGEALSAAQAFATAWPAVFSEVSNDNRLGGAGGMAAALSSQTSKIAEGLREASALAGLDDGQREQIQNELALVDAQQQHISALRELIELKQIDADSAESQIASLERSVRAISRESAELEGLARISAETHNVMQMLGDQAIGGLTEALGESIFAAIDGSESFGAAMAKMTSQVLKSIAIQSLVYAAFETAKAIAALAGVVTAPLAAGHFAAAAKFAAVALIAGTAGAALGAAAGSSNTAGASRGASSAAAQQSQPGEKRTGFASRRDSEPQKIVVNVFLGNATDPAAALHTQKQIRAMAKAA